MADGKALATAGTLVQCQAACIGDTTCLAVDWTEAGKSCASHDTKGDTADEEGTSLYRLNRECAGQSFGASVYEISCIELCRCILTDEAMIRSNTVAVPDEDGCC